MRRFLASVMIVILLMGFGPVRGPVYGDVLSAGSEAELINVMVEQFRQRNENFSIRYRGNEDLSDGNVLSTMAVFDGTEFTTRLQTAYGVAGIETRYTFTTGQDILFNFFIDYDYTLQDSQRLQGDLQRWVDAHVSLDMDDAVKAAVVTRYLSDQMLYVLDDSVNNAYDGFYGLKTACSGYAELAMLLLQKSGAEVKLIGGHIPPGLPDTEYLERRLTPSDFRAMSFGSVQEELQNLHVWNLIRISGRWHHLDATWVDGDADGEPEKGGYSAEYFLGSDRDFGRNHMWVRNEYPAAPDRWWDHGPEPLASFLKAYLNTRLYDYPQVTSLQELNAYAEDAYQSGRGSQAFRITQGVQAYDAFPALGSVSAKVASSSSSYRAVPSYPGDGYVLTLNFKGREADAAEMLPELKTALSVKKGVSFSPLSVLQSPLESGGSQVRWLSLSPTMLSLENGQFKALKQGRGYIGAFTRDEAMIIPVMIEGIPLQVFLNGSVLALDPAPFVVSGRTMVPLRGVFEAMGAKVDYSVQNRRITAVRGGQTMEMTVGSRNAVVNGQNVLLDVPPQILNDRAFVPARFIAESFGAGVEWDDGNNRVMITE